MSTDKKDHWENIYITKAEDQVSWFQPYPNTSMEFVKFFNLPLNANIIDIGGGDSHFVDALLDKGYQNIWVLDISSNAIKRAKHRLGEKASIINWVVSDITEFEPPTENKISKYVSIAENAIKTSGYLVLGTFSETGPEKCSGLPIKQYSEDTMSHRFENSFNKLKCFRKDHVTPFHTTQNFLFCSFQKK